MRLTGTLLIVHSLISRLTLSCGHFYYDKFYCNQSHFKDSNSMWPTLVTWIFDLNIFNFKNLFKINTGNFFLLFVWKQINIQQWYTYVVAKRVAHAPVKTVKKTRRATFRRKPAPAHTTRRRAFTHQKENVFLIFLTILAPRKLSNFNVWNEN